MRTRSIDVPRAQPPVFLRQERITYGSYGRIHLASQSIHRACPRLRRRIQQILSTIVSEHIIESYSHTRRTDNKVWSKFICNGHNDLHECIVVVGIPHPGCGPWDVHRPEGKPECQYIASRQVGMNLRSKSLPFTTSFHTPERSARVK